MLQGIGSENTLIGPEWETARNWTRIYINLFLAIDASLGQIRSILHGKEKTSDLSSLSASQLISEIIKGHYLFWLSRSAKGDWTFSVKAVREGLRRVKKMEETEDRLDTTGYEKLYQKSVQQVIDRVGEDWDFFAVHIVCLLGCEKGASKSQDARHWFTNYQTAMNQLGKTYGKMLR